MNFHTTRSKMKRTNDEWYTVPSSWDKILEYIDKKHIIYEAFYGGGDTYKYFKKKGFKVIGKPNYDFFEDEKLIKKCDVVISNPPFSSKYKIMERLVKHNKPFILILPLHCINTISFRKCFNNDMSNVSVMIPKGRLQYVQNGTLKKSPSFENCFVAYKMIKEKLVFL